MKFFSIIFLAMFGLAWTAEARLGETRDECKARYGEPTRKGVNLLVFNKGGYAIACLFVNDKVEIIQFSGGELSEASRKAILEKNQSITGEWSLPILMPTLTSKPSRCYFYSSDKGGVATFDLDTGILKIMTSYGKEHEREIREEAVKNNVDSLGL